MKRSTIHPLSSGLIALSLLCLACDREEVPSPAAPSSATPSNGKQKQLVPVLSQALGNGNVLEFFDLGDAALVSESGKAGGTTPADHGENHNVDQLLNVWQTALPGRPIPQILHDLQERLIKHSGFSQAVPDLKITKDFVGGEPFTPASGGPGPGAPLAKQSPICNNGCCDFNWVSRVPQCTDYNYFHWFLFNYGWSIINRNYLLFAWTYVCSSIGTSYYTLDFMGKGGILPVPEGGYRTFEIYADWPRRYNMTSSVNSESNQHMHTYCGKVQ